MILNNHRTNAISNYIVVEMTITKIGAEMTIKEIGAEMTITKDWGGDKHQGDRCGDDHKRS